MHGRGTQNYLAAFVGLLIPHSSISFVCGSETATMLTFNTLKSNQICSLIFVDVFGAVCSWLRLWQRLLSLSPTRCSGRVVW